MKKSIIFNMMLAATLMSCTKLDVDVESELTPSNFPTNEESFIAATGPVYTKFRSNFAIDFWRMQELSTDEAIIPVRGGNYDDGGQYRFMHLHTWTADHPYVKNMWEWGFGGINSANRIISVFASAPDGKAKTVSIAEMRAMRALLYYYMMDLYGNVPIIKDVIVKDLPATAPRKDVFAFIESELKAVIPDLNATSGQKTYGRPTKWLAFALLQKLYINAEYYIGQPKYTEAVVMGDSILTRASSIYALDGDYNSIFAPNNGPLVKETIFAIPYDPIVATGNMFSRFGLHPALKTKYNLVFSPSIAMSTLKEFYQKFTLTNDVRNKTLLAGPQFENDGKPILISTTKKGRDASYTGADGAAKIDYHLDFTPDMTLAPGGENTLDIGNDELAKAKGVRSIKFYPDPNTASDTRNSGNDFPVFRLADVILMKAEAILRGATPTTVNGELQTAPILVNKIRKRSGAPEVAAITLDELLDERARELGWEAWRRNDLIRFGKFEKTWGFKTNTDTYRRIFPIPNSERTLNPKLEQNIGYF